MRCSHNCSFGTTTGGSFTDKSAQVFLASAILHDDSRTVRRLDLAPYLETNGSTWCHRVADRWGFANGFLRVYRRKASQRRRLARIGNYSR